MVSKIKQANKVLILTYNLVHEDDELYTIVEYLNIDNKPYVVILCRNPYDILIFLRLQPIFLFMALVE